MSIQDLAAQVWSHREFHSELERASEGHLHRALQVESLFSFDLQFEQMSRLLNAASILAASNDEQHRSAAYKICSIAIDSLASQEFGTQIAEAASLILTRIGNFPAERFLNDRVGSTEGLLGKLWLETESHRESNTVKLASGVFETFTDFQIRLWRSLEKGNATAITAPTSSGKSYVLQRFLVSKVAENGDFIAVYIVPTRALISQVAAAITSVLREIDVSECGVSVVPLAREDLGMSNGIYVLTQERLQLLLEHDPGIPIDLLVVDEAQLLSEGSRGVVLHTVLERVRAGQGSAQFLFGTPAVKNLDVFSGCFGITDYEEITTSDTSVAQNLIGLNSTDLNRNQVQITAKINGEFQGIGERSVPVELFGDNKQKLAVLSWWFGQKSQSIVYFDGQAGCEDVAAKIADLNDEFSESENSEKEYRENLAKFVEDHLHPQYVLASCIRAGTAFHFGNLPTLLRKGLEEAFSENVLTHIVCTTTLLHGVNLPAKNMFMLNPTKGGDEPLSPVEFWNLAGRAGRLGKEFEGNVFLIDYDKWDSKPLEDDREVEITPTIFQAIKERYPEFLGFIRDHDVGSGQEEVLENVFVKLFNDFRRGRLGSTLSKSPVELPHGIEDELAREFASINEGLEVPVHISERHINISVFRVEEMYSYLSKRIDEKEPAELIPKHPLSEGVYESYLRLFKRIHNHFECRPKQDKAHTFFARQAVDWMRGYPLPRIIDSALNHRRSNTSREPKIGTVVREVLRTIENDLRFRYVKYTSCYIDLLLQVLEEKGLNDLATQVPSIPLYLELGASSNTMVNLIGLGLSRTTAEVLADKAANKSMDRQQTQRWLRRRPLDQMDIPDICRREIDGIILQS
ncbi:MAG: DEAD/DEAH box helicase [Pseudomonadota bacterium]